ncbi:hypothetical protein APHAL10511_001789 [Amanita phalloides]|nr:hypothetical protein APHAL10511_001789 [Amanita phalloides]
MRQRGKHSDSSDAQHGQQKLVISEEEQWRLINESGLLKKINTDNQKLSVEQEPEVLPGMEYFDAAFLIIPFSFLLLMMDILVHHQYGKEPPVWELGERTITRVPILSIFIFYTIRYKQHRRMQILLFVLAIFVGCRLLFIINHKSWLVNMRQCPPLATLWIYAVVQLELGPAVLSLLTVGGFVWVKGLRLSF